MIERKNPNEQASFVLTFTLLKQSMPNFTHVHFKLVNVMRNAIGAVLLMMSPLAL